MSRNSLKWPIWANPPANNRTWQGNDSPDKQWIFYKEVLRGITPPYLWRILRNLKNLKNKNNSLSQDALFKGDDSLFKKLLPDCKIYGEYGCGKSTLWVANNSNCKILAVDSSQKWTSKVKKELSNRDGFEIECIDCGEFRFLDEHSGIPMNYECRHNFINYFHSIWIRSVGKPDLVLIDGRFRVACFLCTLINCEPGTKIIFDDYCMRPEYHVVEEFLKPLEKCGRQALFIAPSVKNIKRLNEELIKFSYVID